MLLVIRLRAVCETTKGPCRLVGMTYLLFTGNNIESCSINSSSDLALDAHVHVFK